ncbi:hypothetical protein V5799_015023 [Amblyomma americanum]|uniref:Uncharacterized protein n=1 Tax=Amblyomma americanum TaxID=6943 RepID=A0AAQ4E1C1_AMBAM
MRYNGIVSCSTAVNRELRKRYKFTSTDRLTLYAWNAFEGVCLQCDRKFLTGDHWKLLEVVISSASHEAVTFRHSGRWQREDKPIAWSRRTRGSYDALLLGSGTTWRAGTHSGKRRGGHRDSSLSA